MMDMLITRYVLAFLLNVHQLFMLAIYVDDLNIVGTSEDITNAINYLKNEF